MASRKSGVAGADVMEPSLTSKAGGRVSGATFGTDGPASRGTRAGRGPLPGALVFLMNMWLT